MRVEHLDFKDIVFVEEEAAIVMLGAVQTRSHLKTKIGVPEVIIRHEAGSILGLPELDRGSTIHSESWNVCLSKVELIRMPKEALRQLWALQGLNADEAPLLESIKMQPFFSSFSPLTTYLLAFELITVKVY